MLVEGIKSRPVYHGIEIDPTASRHIFALEGQGAEALLEQVGSLNEKIIAHCEVLYVAGASAGQGCEEALAGLGARQYWQAPTQQTLLFRLRVSLSRADMGTRLYAAGREGFLGLCVKEATDAGMDFTAVRTDHRGSLARRVQCVHCKGMSEDITVSPFQCSHCGLTLFVRDHYSRRLAAFQGVVVDAEEPGVIPPVEELYR